MEFVVVMVYVNIVKQGKVSLFLFVLIINFRLLWFGCLLDRKVYDSLVEENGYFLFGFFEIKVVKEGLIDFDGVFYIYKNFVIKQLLLKRNYEYYY